MQRKLPTQYARPTLVQDREVAPLGKCRGGRFEVKHQLDRKMSLRRPIRAFRFAVPNSLLWWGLTINKLKIIGIQNY